MAMMSIVRLGYSRQPLQLDQISNIMSHGDSDCSDIKDLAPPKESIKDHKDQTETQSAMESEDPVTARMGNFGRWLNCVVR